MTYQPLPITSSLASGTDPQSNGASNLSKRYSQIGSSKRDEIKVNMNWREGGRGGGGGILTPIMKEEEHNNKDGETRFHR